MIDIFESAVGGVIGLALGEGFLALRLRYKLRRLSRGRAIRTRAYLQRNYAEHVTRGGLYLSSQGGRARWRHSKLGSSQIELELLRQLGLQTVRSPRATWTTWVWLVRLPDGNTARLSFEPRSGRAFSRALLPLPEQDRPPRQRRG